MTLGTGVGGMPDVVMRAALNCLRQDGISDVNVVVQNRTGGSWSVSYDFLMDQRGSGNYLGAITQPLVTTPPTRGIDYWHEELRPIALLLGLDVGPMVRGDSPWQTFEDMAQYARANPGALRWGGAQVGATTHIVMVLLENAIGAEIMYVPYESGGAADAALLSGDVDVALYWEQAFGELATNSPCWDDYVLEPVGQNQYIPMPELVDFLAEQAVIHRDILVSIGGVDN